jgi:uncharacterized membrane protein
MTEDAAARSAVLHARAGTRLIVAASLGAAAFAVAMARTAWQVAILLGWDTTAAITVAWIVVVVGPKDAAATARLAMREDDSRAAADLLIVSAAVASLAGVGLGLVKAAQEHGSMEAALTAVAVLSVVLSWTAVQATFTLRYARLYYSEHRGIDFNGDGAPDYRDFAYVALTIGMTYQVSDTDLTTKPIRRAATGHALLSYVFGTFIVAMTINVVAGLLR